MRLKLTDYNPDTGNHRCLDATGNIRWVDIMVSDSFDRPALNNYEEHHRYCKSLVGMEIEVTSLTPYVEIAHGVTLLETKEVSTPV